jgi:hypothetical protein
MCPWYQTWGLTLERTGMPRLTDLWSPARSRKANFSARLPTRLPGIAFTARGRAWFRQDLSKYTALPLRTARAAALAGVIADENDPVTRLARALLTMNDYFHADPDRLNNLADLTAFAATKVGDDEIARTLATLRQPTQASRSGTNGAVPASP